ncbi:hypothetical protein EYR41_010363 [Orbilia oligospora]|uniref:Mitochondrial inner membrane protease subunit 2 n=1 Tax=Orbilia oligospora TaxID=2813651 RepID=A0A8H2DPH2_ORBOL|nr:hypothetical protein TWF132_009424 [Orbilia oligospora]TGJ64300.1 hypothetical protein EYR41_010363 [Orbilia oligospora]
MTSRGSSTGSGPSATTSTGFKSSFGFFRTPRLTQPVKLALGVLSWLPVAIFFFDNVYHVSWVTGRSMYPTFLPDSNAGMRDLILLKKWNAKKNLERGEVVVYRSPIDPELTAIKRVVGLEGDVVVTKKPFPQSEIVVPRNHVWVEGDDIHSHDSNYFGAISTHLIQAKVTHIVWPFSRLGIVEKALPSSTQRRVLPAEHRIVTIFGS